MPCLIHASMALAQVCLTKHVLKTGTYAQDGHMCLRQAHMLKTGTYAQDGHVCSRRARMLKTGTYAQDGHMCLRRAHVLKTGTYAQDGHICLRRAHMLKTGTYLLCLSWDPAERARWPSCAGTQSRLGEMRHCATAPIICYPAGLHRWPVAA